MKALGRALGYMRAYWPQAPAAFLRLVHVSGSTLIPPHLIRRLIDNGPRAGDESLVPAPAGAIVAVALVRATAPLAVPGNGASPGNGSG